jgi:hypothetical protein
MIKLQTIIKDKLDVEEKSSVNVNLKRTSFGERSDLRRCEDEL